MNVRILTASLLLCVVSVFLSSCRKQQGYVFKPTHDDSLRVLQETAQNRADADRFFRSDPASPFVRDTSIQFTGVKWFPADVKYYFQSQLYKYDHPETVAVYGTKGEERKELKYGYFVLPFEGTEYTINVYKDVPGEGRRVSQSLAVWFTDETTGKETYHVGRYVEVGDEDPDPLHLYTINLNNAYNPYCAYSGLYSCAIPRKEDHLAFAVRAGEMIYGH